MVQRVTMQPLVPDTLVILSTKYSLCSRGIQHDERAVFYR